MTNMFAETIDRETLMDMEQTLANFFDPEVERVSFGKYEI